MLFLLALAAPGFDYGGRDEFRVASVKASQGDRPAGGPKDDSSRDLKIWIQASHSFVCPADGTARLPLKVRGVNERCKPTYSWKVNGGVIVGEGAEIVWNLSGVRPQPYKYYDAVVTVKCGSRKASAVWRACVVCPPGVTLRRTPPPSPAPPLCPTISLVTRATATTGQGVPINATLNGGTPGVKPKFKWKVLAGGRIAGRHDADSILVEAGNAGETILAKVEVGGYGPGPPCSATSSIPVVAPTPTRPVLRSVKLTPTSASLAKGTQQFTARAFDQFGRPMAGVAINFESGNTRAATVGRVERDVAGGSATATVNGHAGGTAQIIATGLAGANTATSDPALLTVTTSSPPTPTPTPTPPTMTLGVSVNEIDNGRPIEGAEVLLLNDGGGLVSPDDRRTDASGHFELTGLPPGQYHLKVIAPGFFDQEKSITLEAPRRLDETFSMAPVPAPPEVTPSPTPTPCAACDLCLLNPRRCALPALLGLAALCLGAYFSLSGFTGAFATAAAQDRVYCAVFGPKSARPGESFILPVFAHLAEQKGELEAEAAAYRANRLSGSKPLDQKIERDSTLFFSLQLPGLKVAEQEASLVWTGEVSWAEFCVTVPKEFEPQDVFGTVYVSIANAEGVRVPIGHLKFMLAVAAAADTPQAAAAAPAQAPAPPPAPAPALLQQNYVTHRRAFISYCSKNRAEVLKFVRGLEAARIECFMDKVSLKPGVDWDAALQQFIDQSDVFYLFWSRAASESVPIMNEIEYALKRRGENPMALPEIVPFPLEPTTVVKPPEKLKHLHFDDMWLTLITAEEAAQRQPPAQV